MNETENSSVNNTEQPVTAVNEPLQEAVPVESVTPTEPSIPETPVEEAPMNIEATTVSEPVAPIEPQVTPNIETQPETSVATTETQIAPSIQPTEAKVETTKKSKLPIIIIGVLVAAIIGVLVYFLFFRKVSKTEVINGTINKIFATAEKVSKQLDEAFIIDYKKDIITTNGYLKASIETNDPDIQQLIGDVKNLSLKYDMQINAKDLEAYLNISGNENDKEIVNFSGLLTNKVLYIDSSVFDNVYKQDLSNEVDWNELKSLIDSLPAYDSGIFTKLTNKFKTYLTESIKDEYLSQEEGTYTVDGVEVKGTKTTLTITQKVYYEMIESILTQAKDDGEMIEIISQFSNQSQDNIKSLFEESIKNIKETEITDTETKLYIKIYTTSKGKFLGLEVKIMDQDIATAVSKNDITTIKIKSKVEIKLTYDEKKKELTWVNEAEGNNGEKIVVTFKDNGLKIEFIMNGLKLTLEDEYSNSKTKLDEKVTSSIEYTENGKTTKGSLELACSLEKADSIKKFDISNAKELSEMTYYEQEAINEKLEKAISETAIGKVLLTISQSKKVYATTYDYTLENYNYNSYYDLYE